MYDYDVVYDKMAERKANLLAAKTAKADKKVCDHPFILICWPHTANLSKQLVSTNNMFYKKFGKMQHNHRHP